MQTKLALADIPVFETPQEWADYELKRLAALEPILTKRWKLENKQRRREA